MNNKWLFGMIAILASSSAQAANEIYIEQIGSTATIDVTQQGNANFVGTESNPVVITGSTNDIDVEQIGDGNTLNVELTGDSNQVNTSSTGDTNNVDLYCNTCSGNAINLATTGDNNNMVIGTALEPESFSEATITSSITGSYNITTLVPKTNSVVTQTVVGNQNVTNITHDGGLVGHNSIVSVSGDNNLINSTQTGSETTLNLALTGSDSVINVSASQ